jgi:hypothetical protein
VASDNYLHTCFEVDILSGSSVGEINAVYLAKPRPTTGRCRS